MHDACPLQGADWPIGRLESALTRDGFTKHLEVAHQAPSGIGKGGGLILFKEEMANPSKAIADNGGCDQIFKPADDAPKNDIEQTQTDKARAHNMEAAADHILVLRQIKGIKLLKARKAGRGGVWCFGRSGGGVFVSHAVHVWWPATKRKGQFGCLGKKLLGAGA